MEQKTIEVLWNTPSLIKDKHGGGYYMQPNFLLPNKQKKELELLEVEKKNQTVLEKI